MDKKAERIQTSVLRGVEKKALVWLAQRQPKWVTSDMLTWIGTFGSMLIALGYILSHINVNWLWLSSFGLIVNWYGDSLDGTLARVRNQQRPIYGFYLDHTMDAINEALMFMGAGLSPFMRFDLSCVILVVYLMLTLNVAMNAHLKGEFRLTYAKLGPTEFRLLIVLANTLLIAFPSLASHSWYVPAFNVTMSPFDPLGIVVTALLAIIYISTIISDARKYARIDPPRH
jgi:phosphatidylglycerophosphate synthase